MVQSNTLVDFEKEMVAVQRQNIYLDLINDRGSKVDDTKHKEVLLSGYGKILNFIDRGIKIQRSKTENL